MELNFKAALIASARRVFSTLFLMELECGSTSPFGAAERDADLTAEVDFWGGIEGAVTMRMSPAMAQRIRAMMTGSQPTSVDTGVMDAVGEMASMIAEGALGMLDGTEFTASSPSIRLHSNGMTPQWTTTPAVSIRCACECGTFMIDAWIRARPSGFARSVSSLSEQNIGLH